MDLFSTATRDWFRRNFDGPTEAQAHGWPVIAGGHHCLITAPTGSGKTLAAFLWAIDRLVARATPDRAVAGTSVLYISPLKALVVDIERNLRAPLAGIAHAAVSDGRGLQAPTVAVRTGDTPARERQRQLREPAEILVTTPESLYLMLGSRAAETLVGVETLIVDEVHALAATKRGAHLALSLERLAWLVSENANPDPQRIGLSATVQPLTEAARWLGGEREVEIVDAAAPPRLDLRVSVPVPDMERPPEPPLAHTGVEPEGGPILGELFAREQQHPSENRHAEKGLWSALYPAILAEIMAHRSTIVFVNSRGLCERLSQRLNAQAAVSGVEEGDVLGDAFDAEDPDDLDLDRAAAGFESEQSAMDAGPESDPADGPVPELVRAHHGSVSHQQRAEIEEGLKGGSLKAIVATSSLEMGIDMGGVDQVVLVESPGSVARGLQRVGRAGHGVGEVSTGRIFPKYRGDLLECAVISRRMLDGALEPFRMPRNALDVLAQQLVAHCVNAPRGVEELHSLVNRAGPYRELSRAALESVLDMLSGHYPSSDFADLRPLLAWDRSSDILSARKGAPMVTRLNAGTIPDRGNYAVHLGTDGPRIGELDEEMVFETRAGECILLGASTWRVEDISRDRVIVSPAPGEPGKLPFWRGEGPGRPVELGRAVGAFTREVAALEPDAAAAWIRERTPLDQMAADNLAAYILDQREATGQVPSDRTIVVERFRDELGDWRLCILTPFGARVHGPWAMALQWHLERREGFEVQVMYTDDGIVLRLADGDELPDLSELLPDPDEIEERITEQLADTALFASLFRENAGRALLLPRRSAKGRQPLWAQRLKAQNLLAVVRRYPAFPVVLETYRQALSDVFDLPALKGLLNAVRSRAIRVHEVETRHASPFARSLVFAYVAAYIYEQDAPLAERRAQALTLDRGLLAELLGEAELRALLDPEVLETLERELQHLGPGPEAADEPEPAGAESGQHGPGGADGIDRRARDADELHDLLRRLGDLTDAEVAARCVPTPDLEHDAGDEPFEAASDWLGTLKQQRRAVAVRIAEDRRWIAAEDAALYRDALGCVPPPGLPERFIAPTEAPLEQLLRRYARTHGPFTSAELAARLGLRTAQVEPVLRLLEAQGVLVHGEIRPAGSGPEWCDAEILRRLRRRTLARARDQVAAVDGATLARFLAVWHGIGEQRQGRERLLEVLTQLEGLSVGWRHLDRVLLPARVPGYRSEDLDLLAATGQIVWVGRGASGPRDGRIAIYRRENAFAAIDADRNRSAPDAEAAEDGASQRLRALLLAHLRRRGACFLFELQQVAERVDGAPSGLDAAAFEQVLWDMVWDGMLTNDTFAPLRGLGTRSRAPARGRGRRRGGRLAPSAGPAALAGGRWSLVDELAGDALWAEHGSASAGVTERALARVRMLLERYGLVSREMVAAEGLSGGFGPVYKVLKQMEEAGRVRRGYFVEGLSGAQFALPGAVERLRAARLDEQPLDGFGDEDVCLLAATDPANPYGALLPWPSPDLDTVALTGGVPAQVAEDSGGSARQRQGAAAGPKRMDGAWVILVAGRPVLYLGASGKHLMTFPDGISDEGDELTPALAALPRVPHAGRKRRRIERIDALPALESPLREALLAAGFEIDYDALVPAPFAPGSNRAASNQGRGIGRDPNAIGCAG